MEDPDADDTKAFVEAQNELSLPYLQEYSLRNKFFERLKNFFVQSNLKLISQ